MGYFSNSFTICRRWLLGSLYLRICVPFFTRRAAVNNFLKKPLDKWSFVWYIIVVREGSEVNGAKSSL
jgi:hypothetical protein